MKINLILVFALLVPSSAISAAPVMVGTTQIELPAPAGFARVVPEMKDVSELYELFVYPGNQQLIVFIPEEDVAPALAGEIPPSERYLSVQVVKEIADRHVTAGDFRAIKRMFVSDIERTVEELREPLADAMSDVSRSLSDRWDEHVEIETGGMVPLAVHHQDAHSIAFSMIRKREYRFGDDEPIDEVTAATMSMVHVGNRALMLYAFGSMDDLDWSREFSKRWVETTVAANVGRHAESSSRFSHRAVRGIDWGSAFAKGAAGGIIVLLVMFVGRLFGRRSG